MSAEPKLKQKFHSTVENPVTFDVGPVVYTFAFFLLRSAQLFFPFSDAVLSALSNGTGFSDGAAWAGGHFDSLKDYFRFFPFKPSIF